MGHTELLQPQAQLQQVSCHGAKPADLFFRPFLFHQQNTHRDAFLVNIDPTATTIDDFHSPSSRRRRQRMPTTNAESLSHAPQMRAIVCVSSRHPGSTRERARARQPVTTSSVFSPGTDLLSFFFVVAFR